MALQTVGNVFIPRLPSGVNGLPTFANLLIDAGDEKVGFLVQAPKTGNITKVGFVTGAVNTGATVDCRIETVDAATGDPSGTLWGTNTNGALVIASTDDNLWLTATLTAAAAVTKGQFLAVVIVNPTVSPGNLNLRGFGDDVNGFPYADLFTTVWTKSSTVAPVVAVEYDDGSYAAIPGVFPGSAITTNTYGNATSPNSRGLRFQVPFSCRVSGAWVWADLDGDSDVKLVTTAYHKGNATGILVSVSLDKEFRSSNAALITIALFASPVTLTANTTYRLLLEPTSATTLALYDYSVTSLALLGATQMGPNWHFTTANDPTADGSWTNYNSGTFRVPFMGLIVDQFDDGAGGVGSIFGGLVVR